MNLGKQRCVNIDWLEVYCEEDNSLFPLNADFFRSQHWWVKERDYGTRQYEQMFTLLDKDGHAFVEIRRCPVSGSMAERNDGIFNPLSCHIRLANRYCYANNAVDLFSEFLHRYRYTIHRLFRLDLCLDFEKFDKGDDPQDVLKRYMKGKYTKINQGKVSAHGEDRWSTRDWNSLSWGAPKSMVSTKFYNKTLELKEVKDKPYIRYAWFSSGLVDDWNDLSKMGEDGQKYFPNIWRVEFSIRSTARGWYVAEDCSGKKKQTMRMEHHLGTYATKEAQLKAFASLADHYFHFKKYEEGVRKDRCEDKVLFDWGEHTTYRIDRLLTDAPRNKSLDSLERKLREFRIVHPRDDVRKGCDLLLDYIMQLKVSNSLPNPFSQDETKLLQLLLQRRLNGANESLTDSIENVKALLSLDDIF